MGAPFSLHPLDPKFVGPKPIEEIDPAAVAQAEARGDLIIQRKRNGYGTFIPVGSSGAGLYSRLITPWTGKFPLLEQQLREMRIPNDTLLAGEMFVQQDGIDDPHLFGRFARTNWMASIKLQRSFPPARLALFNVLVHKGKDVSRLPYRDRLHIVQELCDKHRVSYVSVVDILKQSLHEAQNTARVHKWEGLVLYDASARTAFRTDGGQTPRPPGCWKWKEYTESDFVATGWVPSTSASFKGLVRDLLISQYDPTTGKLESWGRVGNGLSVEQKREFADDAKYPFVVEVSFECRTQNHRLQKAHIVRVRDDKRPDECIAPRLAA